MVSTVAWFMFFTSLAYNTSKLIFLWALIASKALAQDILDKFSR